MRPGADQARRRRSLRRQLNRELADEAASKAVVREDADRPLPLGESEHVGYVGPMPAIPKRPVSQSSEADDVFRGFPEEALATYLLRLPFNLALDSGQIQTLRLSDAENTEGRTPPIEVRFRLLRLKTGGERYFATRLSAAAVGLYNIELDLGEPDALYAPEEAYETWVSAETPLRRARSEPEYPARTLERCLGALRVMLTAYRLATRDQNVYPVGPAAVDKW